MSFAREHGMTYFEISTDNLKQVIYVLESAIEQVFESINQGKLGEYQPPRFYEKYGIKVLGDKFKLDNPTPEDLQKKHYYYAEEEDFDDDDEKEQPEDYRQKIRRIWVIIKNKIYSNPCAAVTIASVAIFGICYFYSKA
jgi:hypothetical protein